jgi:putative redox protein
MVRSPNFVLEPLMVEIQIAYEGKLRCSARHVDSGVTLITDAPKDNMGQGASFSPTDLVATALGTCMLTIMGIAAQKMELDLSGASVVVTKEMIADPLRRIGTLAVTFNLPGRCTPEQRQKLANAAMTCPVHKSLHPNVQRPITFNWV